MTNVVARFAKNESGTAHVEYGLIVAAVAVAILNIVFSIGSHTSATFEAIAALFRGQTGF